VTGTISGLHHITVISGNAQRNLNFYANVLGLRFIKDG
jgi:glyoxalase family protein